MLFLKGLFFLYFELSNLETPPKFIYIQPYFQNPTGLSLNSQQISRLFKLSSIYNFMIWCDEIYSFLHFSSSEIKPSLIGFESEFLQ